MAKQVEFPGLKEHIEDIANLREEIKKLLKVQLDLAVAKEEELKQYTKGAASIKTYISAQEAYNKGIKEDEENTKKIITAKSALEKAQDRLKAAMTDEAKKIAEVNLQIQRQNAENKIAAKASLENASALEKFNAKMTEALSKAKNLGAEMKLMEMAGKQDSETYRQLAADFEIASQESKKLQDDYREISKLSGDNKALVGSYAEETKGNFEGLKGSIDNLLVSSGLYDNKIVSMAKSTIGFVQTGTQAIQKIKDINDNLVNGVKNLIGFGNASKVAEEAQLGLAAAEEVTVVATTESNAVEKASIGFKTASKTATVAETTATEAQTVAKNASSASSKGLATSQIALAGASETAAVAEGTATAATTALDIALGVLLAPITLIIAAFGLLVYIFKDFAPLVNPVKDAFAALGAVFATVKQAIFDLVTGARSLGDIIKNLGSDIGEAAKEAYELGKATRDLAKAQDVNEVSMEKTKTLVQQLILQSKDRSKSEKERIDLINKAQKLEEDQFKKTNDLNNRAIEIARKKLFESKNLSKEDKKRIAEDDYEYIRSLKVKKQLDDEELKSYKELLIKKQSLAQEHNQIMEKAQNRENQLAEKAEQDAEKARDKAEKDAEKAKEKREKAQKDAEEHAKKSMELAINLKKAEIDSLTSSYNQEEHLATDNIKFVEDIAAKKTVIAKLELAKNLIGVQKNSDDYKLIFQKSAEDQKKIEAEKNTAIGKIKSDNAKFELELYDANQKSLLSGVVNLTDDIVKAENDRLKEVLDVHKKALLEEYKIDEEKLDAKIKNNEKLTQNEFRYLQAVKKQTEETNREIKKNEKDLFDFKLKLVEDESRRESRLYKLTIDSDNKLLLHEYDINFKKLRNQRKLFAEQLKDEKKSADEKIAIQRRIDDIDISLAENSKTRERIVFEAKKQLREDFIEFAIDIFGQESTAGKIFSSAQVTMDTYQKAAELIAISAKETALAAASTAEYDFGGAAMHTSAAILSETNAGLVVAKGLASVAQINGIKLFYEGSDFIPYTGLAIKDELGPELHLDRHGNIKSWGSDDGAHLTKVEYGDEIKTADVTAMIRQTAFAEPIHRIELAQWRNNALDSDRFDYDEIDKRFDKSANKIVKAIKDNKTNITITNDRGSDFYNRVRHIGKKV